MLGQLVDDYLLDFDIFHVSNVTELLHYVDQKYLGEDLGGQASTDVDQWLLVQVRVPPALLSVLWLLFAESAKKFQHSEGKFLNCLWL